MELTCDSCGRVGSEEDGIEPGGPCQEPCGGLVYGVPSFKAGDRAWLHAAEMGDVVVHVEESLGSGFSDGRPSYRVSLTVDETEMEAWR